MRDLEGLDDSITTETEEEPGEDIDKTRQATLQHIGRKVLRTKCNSHYPWNLFVL